MLIRCPDIEQYLYRDRAFEDVHAGLGMVKLANFGFRESRYDFVSFLPRRLPTPISKLHKLRMRLEKTDGSLYNSRGIDHHLILVVRYLEVLKPPDATSRQNPHYDPAALHLRLITEDDLRRRVEQGFRMLALGADTGLLLRSLHSTLKAVGRDRRMTTALTPGPEVKT